MGLNMRISRRAIAVAVLCAGVPGSFGQIASGGDPDTGLLVEMKASKLQVKVGEAIRFTVRGNRMFHLYLIGYERPRPGETKSRTGFCWFTLTSRLLSVQINADKTVTVPFDDAKLDAESPGIEEFQLIASREPLALPPELRRCGADGASVPKSGTAATIPATVVVRTFRIVVEN